MKKSIQILSLVFCIFISQLYTYAQDKDRVTVFSLNEVIKIAQQQSPDAMVAKLKYLSQYWQFKYYKANYLPDLTFNGTLPSFTRDVRKIETVDGDQYVNYSNDSYSGSISINQKIPFTGGNLSITSSLNRSDNISDNNKISTYSGTPLSIRYSQQLFGFNNFKWDRKLEPKQYEIAKKNYIETLEDVSIRATNVFFDLLTSRIRLEIAKVNYKNYDTLYMVSKGRFKLGKIAENELLQIELQKLKSETNLTDSRLDYDNNLFKFKSFLRISNLGKIHLIPPKEVFELNINIDKAVEYAKRNTSKALNLELQELQYEKNIEKAKRDRNPDIRLNANYGISNTASNLAGVYQEPNTSKGFSLGLTIPILDWGRKKGQYKIAEYKYIMDKTNLEQNRIDFEQDVRLKVIRFSHLNKQLLIAKKSDIIAEKSYDLTQKRYLIGKINDILKLTDAQQQYDQAKISYYNAIKNFWIEYFNLRKLTLYNFKNNKFINVDFESIH